MLHWDHATRERGRAQDKTATDKDKTATDPAKLEGASSAKQA